MAEEGPKIEIAGAHEDIDSIKKRAEATRVNPYEPVKKEEEGIGSKLKEMAIGAAVGAVVGGGVEEVAEGIKEGIKERISGKEKEENQIHNASFAKVMSLSNDQSLSKEERDKWKKEKDLRIEELENFDNGNFAADTRKYFQHLMRTSKWEAETKDEEGVYDRLNRYSESRDVEYRGREGSDARLYGVFGVAIRAEAARVLVAGIENKVGGMEEQSREIWLKAKNYTDDEVARLKKVATENHIFDFATDAPEELVSKLVKKEAGYEKPEKDTQRLVEERIQQILGGRERAQIPAPKHMGALFKGGLYEDYFRHKTIPVLDIKNPKERDIFIFENIHIFDYLLEQPGAWQGALGEWLSDTYFAARENRLDSKDLGEFEVKLKAMMAVTTSARCMEKSNGSIEGYGVWLTTGGQGKEADLDIQDQLKDKVLHKDSKKIEVVLRDPLVKAYYDKLVDDMGVRMYEEWVDKMGTKRYTFLSEIQFDKQIKDIREGGPKCKLVDYLKGKAEENNGFAGYIEHELLRGENPNSPDWDVKWGAARLACDLVMVDGTYTRWEYDITNGKEGEEVRWGPKSELELFPIRNWGGDPLRSLLEPSFLPYKIKGVYHNKLGREIMDDLDRTFRPEDAFEGRTIELKPRMTEDWKKLARWGRAHWIVLGGSQAEKLGAWSKETEGELGEVALRLNEVYGHPSVKDGKHVVGAMMARIIKAKAKAYAAQMEEVWGLEAFSRAFGDIKNHPNYEILRTLWGPKVDATSGLRAELAGPGLQFVFKGNKFGAYDDLVTAKAILETGNPRAKGGVVGSAVARGIGDVLRAFGGSR